MTIEQKLETQRKVLVNIYVIFRKIEKILPKEILQSNEYLEIPKLLKDLK